MPFLCPPVGPDPLVHLRAKEQMFLHGMLESTRVSQMGHAVQFLHTCAERGMQDSALIIIATWYCEGPGMTQQLYMNYWHPHDDIMTKIPPFKAPPGELISPGLTALEDADCDECDYMVDPQFPVWRLTDSPPHQESRIREEAPECRYADLRPRATFGCCQRMLVASLWESRCIQQQLHLYGKSGRCDRWWSEDLMIGLLGAIPWSWACLLSKSP